MIKVKRSYYYIFYVFYRLSERAPAKFWSEWKAGLIVLALELWCMYSLLNYYNFFVDNSFEPSRELLILIGILVAGINFVSFIYGNEWKIFVKEFTSYPSKRRKNLDLRVWLLCVFIISNLIFSFFLLSLEIVS